MRPRKEKTQVGFWQRRKNTPFKEEKARKIAKQGQKRAKNSKADRKTGAFPVGAEERNGENRAKNRQAVLTSRPLCTIISHNRNTEAGE